MSYRLVIDMLDIRIVKAQSDVVMTTDVVEPGGAVQFARQTAYALIQGLAFFVATASHNSAMNVAL